MNKIKNIIKVWLPFVLVVSAFCLLVYAAVQQAYRQDANDPQIQMANDTADALVDGKNITALVPAQKVSVAKSLAPFLIVYDANGNELASSVTLDGKTPPLPDGVLNSTKKLGENRITWQPKESVRIAAVIVYHKDGFVLAGRNMREVEIRETQLGNFAGATWILAMIGTFIAIAFSEYFLSDSR